MSAKIAQYSEHLKNLLLLMISVGVVLGLTEVALRLADFPKQSIKFERLADPILLYRMPGDFPGVNREGYRNLTLPTHADIVALGDSHTYGYNTTLENTWPSQIARMTGFPVYNMGVGGYGPLQYYYQFDRALELKPRYVVLGLYLANDIKGVCDLYLKTTYWKTRTLQENLDLRYCNEAVHKSSGQQKQKRAGKTKSSGESSNPILDSKIATLLQLGMRVGKSYFPFGTKSFIVISDGKNRVHMINKEVRNNRDYMDLGRPEIEKSLAVTKELISRMAVRAQENGAKLVVLVIPSKGYILNAYSKKLNHELPGFYEQSASNEAALGSNVMAWLKAKNIPYVDAKFAVEAAMSREGGVYPLDGDDHPTAIGYKAYAQALYDGYFADVKP